MEILYRLSYKNCKNFKIFEIKITYRETTLFLRNYTTKKVAFRIWSRCSDT